jgi:hypothetical protein
MLGKMIVNACHSTFGSSMSSASFGGGVMSSGMMSSGVLPSGVSLGLKVLPLPAIGLELPLMPAKAELPPHAAVVHGRRAACAG